MNNEEKFISEISKLFATYHREQLNEAIKRGVAEAKKQGKNIWKTK